MWEPNPGGIVIVFKGLHLFFRRILCTANRTLLGEKCGRNCFQTGARKSVRAGT